jgi:uncharacterized protein (TIGR02996 family)
MSSRDAATRQAFLEAICENADDDAPRLIFADWLDEHGEPERAEFIRLQCRLASMGEEDPQRPALEKREAQIWRKNARRWQAKQPRLTGVKWGKSERGWPASVELDGVARFCTHAARIVAAAPVRRLFLRNVTPASLPDLAVAPSLARFHTLELWGTQADWAAEMRSLLESPHLGTLRGLILRFSSLGLPGVRLIAACPRLGSLSTLGLSQQVTDPKCVAALATSPHLASLTRLDLSSCPFGPAGVRALTASTRFTRLEALDLSYDRLGLDGLRVLLRARHLPALTELNLERNHLGDAGAAELAASPWVSRLTQLVLKGNDIGDAGADALAQSPHLGRLRTLLLQFNMIRFEGARALAKTPHTALRYLGVGGNPITDAALKLLAKRFDPRTLEIW